MVCCTAAAADPTANDLSSDEPGTLVACVFVLAASAASLP